MCPRLRDLASGRGAISRNLRHTFLALSVDSSVSQPRIADEGKATTNQRLKVGSLSPYVSVSNHSLLFDLNRIMLQVSVNERGTPSRIAANLPYSQLPLIVCVCLLVVLLLANVCLLACLLCKFATCSQKQIRND